MMQHSESLKELATALAKAQAEIENADKNAKNPHFKSTYADLAEVINTSRPVLTKHGLSVVQLPGMEGGSATLETILLHSSGEWLSGVASAPLTKNDPQGVGSALTYLRRYSLAAVCNIAQEDDDGNGAVSKPAAERTAASSTQPWERVMPFGKTKGKPLGEIDTKDLLSAKKWCEEKGAEKFADLLSDITATLAYNAARQGPSYSDVSTEFPMDDDFDHSDEPPLPF